MAAAAGAGAAAPKKVVKKDGSKLSDVEARVDAALAELQASTPALKDLSKISFSGAKEVGVGEHGASAVLVFVPVKQLRDLKKIQARLIDELEKKLTAGVVIVANRTMVSSGTWARKKSLGGGVRPRNRSLKAVQEAALDDIVFPAEIVGKRTRVAIDGGRVLRVLLSHKDAVTLDKKTDTFAAVYQKLTGKQVAFEFHSTTH